MLFAEHAVTRTLARHRPALVAEWETLVERLSSQSARRNKLAHHNVLVYPNSAEGRRIALCAWILPKNRDRTKPPDDAMCIMEIVRARLEFRALVIAIENFVARAAGQPEPHSRDDERPPDPPTIRQTSDLIHEALGHPRKSSRQKRREEDERNAAESLKVPLPRGMGDGETEEDQADRDDGGRTIAAHACNASKPEDGKEENGKTH